MSAAAPLIHLHGIRKVFRSGAVSTRALDGVDLEIGGGEFVAVTGPSGCGKSTLLSILGLLEAPSAGAYRLAGHDAAALGAAERARIRNREIGFIFQSFNLIGDLTAQRNVELPLAYRGLEARERAARAAAALERVAMAHRADYLPGELSGGEQQRVAIARAVAGAPRVLLADEPTGNLDSASGEAVMDLLRELHADGTTVVLVTHDPHFGAAAQRIVRLLDGRIVDEA